MQEVNKEKLNYVQTLRALKDRGLTSSEDLATVLDVSARQIDHVLDITSSHEFKGSQLLSVSRHLSRIGQVQLSKLGLDGRYVIELCTAGSANGIIDDEITNMTQLHGHLIDAYRARNKEACNKAIRELKDQIKNVELEIERL